MVCEEFGGRLPKDPAMLRTLPGLGAYTSASAAVFAFNALHLPGKVAAIAEALGLEPVSASGPEALARSIHAGLTGFLREVGVSPAAADHGVDGAALAGFAEELAQDPYRFRNQPGTLDAARLLALFQASHRGTFPELSP